MDICKDQEMEFNHDMPVTEKYLKTLIQGVLVLVCDVMAGWPPPQPIERVIMVLGQLFITDLTLCKRRSNEGIYKTLHNRAFAYYHKRTILP